MFYRNTILLIIWVTLITMPLFSSATFSDSNNQSGTSTFLISPNDIFMKFRNFLTITPHKGTTTDLSINVTINKGEISKKTKSWFQSTKDYIINYSEAVGRNIQQKTGVDVIAIFMFFYKNLYNMFATTLGLIKSVLPQ